MSKKILVVDDEPQIVKVLKAYLEKAGYQVVTASDGNAALSTFQREKPDFLILDLNLPGMDGLDVCKTVRRDSNIPILMLTARVEETDRLIGLELGADDYVVKPYSPREVVARVKTIFRRTAAEPLKTEIIQVGDLIIDLEKHTVNLANRSIELTPTEFEILLTLARQPKRVFTRLQIMELAQGDAFEGYERTIDAHIKNIRNKLELNPKKPIYIQTVFGLGYKLDTDQNA
ncbi:MAG: response regulator transcription factor [Anaerolineaceae bacterium]|nr:MAG: DNA-binding response regulator [Chloroflexi bacterium HGW-Chloroflexi-8]